MRSAVGSASVLILLSTCLASAARAAEPAPSFEFASGVPRVRPLATGVVAKSTPLASTVQRAAPLLPARLQNSNRFTAAHPLLQRISSNVERAGLPWPGPADPERHLRIFEEDLKKGVVHAARRAFKRVVLDAMDVNRFGPDPSTPSPDETGAVRFRLGVSHVAPRLDVRTRVGGGTLNLSVGALGQVGLELAPGGAAQSRLHVGYDRPSRTYLFSFRIGS